jgi:hypothetical protein
MIELLLAYSVAAALISVLVVMARRNRRQGWRKRRGQWVDVELSAATRAFEAKETPSHMGDLGRLQQSLTAFGQSTSPEPAKPVKPSVLA